MDQNLFGFNNFTAIQSNSDSTHSTSQIYHLSTQDGNLNDFLNEFNSSQDDFNCLDSSIDDTLDVVSRTDLDKFDVSEYMTIGEFKEPQENQIIATGVISSPSQLSVFTSSSENHDSPLSFLNPAPDNLLNQMKNSSMLLSGSLALSSPPMANSQPINLPFDQLGTLYSGPNNQLLIRPNGTAIETFEKMDELFSVGREATTKNQQNFSVAGRRKPSHNAIEKRYRTSINDKILELKKLVSPTDEKIQKSAILRRTIDYIRHLRSTNVHLQEENETLKSILKRLNLTTDSQSISLGNANERRSSIRDNPTKRAKRSSTKQGMVNGSRLVLCCFMLCIFIANPFDTVLDRLHVSNKNEPANDIRSVIHARTLKAEDHLNFSNPSPFLTDSWKKIVGWMLNLAICLACLTKIFVHGYPIVDESEMNEYFKYKTQADQRIDQRQFEEARDFYYKACEQLYQYKNCSWTSRCLSIIWETIRLILNIVFIGRWLTYWSGWSKSIDTRVYHCQLNDCFLQLWKLTYQRKSNIFKLIDVALSTINAGIASGKILRTSTKNEMILLLAITLPKINWFPSFLIVQILKLFKPTEMKDLCFLDVDRFYRFIQRKHIDLFTNQSMIKSIRKQYLDQVVCDEIINKIMFQDDAQLPIRDEEEFDEYFWWQHCLRVSQLITRENDFHRSKQQIRSSIYEIARKTESIDHRYIFIVETMHQLVSLINEHADLTNEQRTCLLLKLGEISQILVSINDKNCSLILAVHTLLLDSILSLRLRLFTGSVQFKSPTNSELEQFQSELNDYKILTKTMKIPKERIRLFESVFRALNGLNPLRIQTEFESSLKQIDESLQRQKVLPNSDIIAALLVFCHLLPTAIFRYRSTFQQIINLSTSNEKNRQLHRLKQQYQSIIRQPYLTL